MYFVTESDKNKKKSILFYILARVDVDFLFYSFFSGLGLCSCALENIGRALPSMQENRLDTSVVIAVTVSTYVRRVPSLGLRSTLRSPGM